MKNTPKLTHLTTIFDDLLLNLIKEKANLVNLGYVWMWLWIMEYYWQVGASKSKLNNFFLPCSTLLCFFFVSLSWAE